MARKNSGRKLSPLRNKPKSLSRKSSSASMGHSTVAEILASTQLNVAQSPEERLKMTEHMLKACLEQISAMHFENELQNLKNTQLQQETNSQIWDLQSKKHGLELQVGRLEKAAAAATAAAESAVGGLRAEMDRGLKAALARVAGLRVELGEERRRTNQLERLLEQHGIEVPLAEKA
mmetsp:Transcript_5449/g.9470  ORF Transcript_5449/g.9470 Transcript_5449/m.9470 type:complete len:177 (+) Transcript_5449:1-531(+)